MSSLAENTIYNVPQIGIVSRSEKPVNETNVCILRVNFVQSRYWWDQ